MFEGIIRNAMSRGRVVLDENLEDIANELRKKNIIVLQPPKGMKDNDIKESMLSGRLLITNNSKDFVNDASSYEYGIIATENIRFKDPKKLAKLISDVIIDLNLWSKEKPFIVTLHEDKKHNFKHLTD